MSESAQSRQILTMEMNESAASVSFGKKNGCYVKRGVAMLLGILFVCSLVATGVLVYYFAPHVHYEAGHHEKKRSSMESLVGTGSQGSASGDANKIHNSITKQTSKDKKKMDVRLPRSLKPLHYTVKLQPFINGNFSIMGYVEVEIEVLKETGIITLHIADIITFNETTKVIDADNKQGPSIQIKSQTYDKEREFYQAHLGQNLLKGKRYVLSMFFQGYLNDQLKGFYRSSYKDDTGMDKWIAVTQFQPTDARRAFPCFDEPAMKATFKVFLARETSMSSISNMPKIDTQPVDGQAGWVWDHFDVSVPMSTYLVAFIISDFESKESLTKNNVTFRLWARRAAIQQANYALEKGPEILTFFEDYFSIPYPLPKQDMIAIPDFSAGAMENWGLITYRETAMLYDPLVSAAVNKQRVGIVVAHELAHQWFGNLVTPKWWTDLWLNEGFASFMEYLGTNHAEPQWQMMEQIVINDVQSVFALDCLESSHPISIPVRHPDEINEIFDRISYSKGASIIRMMNFFLTEATFRRGLTSYLKDKAYANAEQDDLWDFLTRTAHTDGTLPKDVTVKTIMDTWTLQMGYPVVTVARTPDGTSATVSQERFLLVKNVNSTDKHDYKWWVPLSYTTQPRPDFTSTAPTKWMSAVQSQVTVTSLPDSSQWVIFNIQQTGYYRVNYDETNWNLLIKQLNTNHLGIHVINRAQLIDDALNLARAGKLSYSVAMDVNAYLNNEKSYIPWAAALNNMKYIEKMFSRTGNYGALKAFMLGLLIPLYNSVGFDDSPTDPHLDQFKRVKVLYWTCKLGHQDCIDRSVSLFRRWMQNPDSKSIISPNLKDVVYCTAIAAGGDDEWMFAWKQYHASNVATEKAKLLSAMGCSKQIWILSRYLKKAFTPESGIRKQDAGRVFTAVARNNVGRDLAWTYLRDKWTHILEYYGSSIFTLPRIIKSGTNGMNKELQLNELKRFQKNNENNLGAAKRAVSQAIERTINNIAWMNNNYGLIVQWLADKGHSSTLKSV